MAELKNDFWINMYKGFLKNVYDLFLIVSSFTLLNKN